MADPNCHYCDRPAVEECPTCGRLYCQEHGEDVCLRCMSPEAATPSAVVFRGSIVALALASLVAVFLMIRPPESKSTSSQVRTVATPTQQSNPTATPTPPGSQPTRTAASGSATAAPSATAPSTTATSSASPSPSAVARTYTVQSGDSLSSIAARNNTTVDAITAANPGVTASTPIQIGQVLNLP